MVVTKVIKKSCTIKAIRGDNSENVANTVKYCKKNGISKLVLEKGEYHFYPELAAEAQIAVCPITDITVSAARRSS